MSFRRPGLTLSTSVCLSYYFPSIYLLFNRTWIGGCSFFLTNICRIKFYFHGDEFDSEQDHNILLLSNHNNRLDWLFLWSLCLKLNCIIIFNLKILNLMLLRFTKTSHYFEKRYFKTSICGLGCMGVWLHISVCLKVD